MSAYYNENDAQKAAWLRELITQNVVAPGEVDERSIAEVVPSDLRGFVQCHFFAGIGVWSYALRLAGWADDRPVWTGSCPCPSFSAAGKGKGFTDPRHLWPHWIRLIRECRPPVVIGEQVAAAIGHGWLDVVYVDLEAEAYSVGAVVLGACSVGAPHIRQRLYFGAHAAGSRRQDASAGRGCTPGRTGATLSGQGSRGEAERSSLPGDRSDSDVRLPSHRDLQRQASASVGYGSSVNATGSTLDGAHADAGRSQIGRAESREQDRHVSDEDLRPETQEFRDTSDSSDTPQRGQPMHGSASGNGGHATQPDELSLGSDASRTGEATAQLPRQRHEPEQIMFGSQPLSPRLEGHFGDVRDWRGPGWLDPVTARSVAEAGATSGFWADCDWWHARDEKFRPIEPGLFPLAHGAANRVLKLRGYGDAIIPQVAQAFITAFMEVHP